MAVADLLARASHGIAAFSLWAMKGAYHASTLSGNITLDSTYPVFCGFDPGGSARDVTLEGSAAVDLAVSGLVRVIINKADAAENIVVKDGGGNTIATVNQNDTGIFYNDPDAGWVLVLMTVTALT